MTAISSEMDEYGINILGIYVNIEWLVKNIFYPMMEVKWFKVERINLEDLVLGSTFQRILKMHCLVTTQ